MLKNWIISLAAIFFAPVLLAQGGFTPVSPSGLPYNLVISGITLNSAPCPANTQIGVFDDTLCVGTGTWAGNGNIQLVCWQGDASQQLPGFTPGNTMLFKLYIPWGSQNISLDAQAVYSQGNGEFAYGSFSVLSLQAYDPILSSEEFNLNSLLVYPNPIQDRLYIQCGKNPVNEVYISTILGEEQFYLTYSSPAYNLIEFPSHYISTLKEGLYLMSIRTEKEVLTKIIIVKK